MTVIDQSVDIRYLNYGIDPDVDSGPNEHPTCCSKGGQTLDQAAQEMLQGLFEMHLTEGLPGPVNFSQLVPQLKAAAAQVELEPVDGDDRVHWFMLRWTVLN